jgi:hypothetical protein
VGQQAEGGWRSQPLGESWELLGTLKFPKRGTRGTGVPRTWLLWAKLVNRAFADLRPRPRSPSNGGLAAKYADQGAFFTKESTAIKSMRSQRERDTSMGQPTADVAEAGFATSRSAIDILRELASQGALHKACFALSAYPARG